VRSLLSAQVPLVDLSSDQGLAELKAAGWLTSPQVDHNQPGSPDDFRVADGVLILTDDDPTTANGWRHDVWMNPTATSAGRLILEVGTAGSWNGGQKHVVELYNGQTLLAAIILTDHNQGVFQVNGAQFTFQDTASWRDEFRAIHIEWSAQDGLARLTFIDAAGNTQQSPAFALPVAASVDRLLLGTGFSSAVDSQLHIRRLDLETELQVPEITQPAYLDVPAGAPAGTIVTGKLHVPPTSSDRILSFQLTGADADLFQVESTTDFEGRTVAVLSVAQDLPVDELRTYSFDITVTDGLRASVTQTLSIHAVDTTLLAGYRTDFIDEVIDLTIDAQAILDANLSDEYLSTDDLWALIQDDGTIVNVTSVPGLYGDVQTREVQLLASLAKDLYAEFSEVRKNRLYDAIIAWNQNVVHNPRSIHFIRTRPEQLGVIGYYLFETLTSEAAGADVAAAVRAGQVRDAILQGSETVLFGQADFPDEEWGANLAYRLRALELRALLLDDYNEPVSWFENSLPDAEPLDRGFQPSASFADIRSLMHSSFYSVDQPTFVGPTADGGFSQHVGALYDQTSHSVEITGGFQSYILGYGEDWISRTTQTANRLKSTPWSLSENDVNALADFYIHGIQWHIYNGHANLLSVGRHAAKATFDSDIVGVLLEELPGLIALVPAGSERQLQLMALQTALQTDTLSVQGNLALWNIEQMVHRRDNYFVSTKLNSVRSSGNELQGTNNLFHYFWGDGTTLIQRTGDEYSQVRSAWDWNRLPGTTTAEALAAFDFSRNMSLSQLQAAGWIPFAAVSHNSPTETSPVDDFRVDNGVLILTDDYGDPDVDLPVEYRHDVQYPFGDTVSGRLSVSAGTGGSWTGGQNHVISLMGAGQPLATIRLTGNGTGTFMTGGSDFVFSDSAGWHDQFRNFQIEWGLNGNSEPWVQLTFIDQAGKVWNSGRKALSHAAVPDAVLLGTGFSGAVDSQLRIQSLQISDLPQHNSNFHNRGLNEFAGVVSDGRIGLASFINDRFDGSEYYNYHAVRSSKSTFFFDSEFVALGSGIARAAGAATDSRDIFTTINQTELRSDVVYAHSDQPQQVTTVSADAFETTDSTIAAHSHAWFHHDGVGYLIVANDQAVSYRLQTRRETGRNWYDIDHSNTPQSTSVDILDLAILHGAQPANDTYHYIVLPDVPDAGQMPDRVTDIMQRLQVIQNTTEAQVVRDITSNTTQAVFYQGNTTVELEPGLQLTASREALVLITAGEEPGQVRITVSDPVHSLTDGSLTLTLSKQLIGAGATWDGQNTTILIPLSNQFFEAGQPVSLQLMSATQGRIVNVAVTGLPLQPEVQWESLFGFDRYEIWISDITADSPTFGKVFGSDQLTGNRLVVESGVLTSGHSYRVWIRGIGLEDPNGAWSSGFEFEVG
jgi:hypothetical protein